MKLNKIDNLQSLLEEKQRLTGLVKLQEQELNERVLFFQSNYKSIIWENINPFKGDTTLSQIAGLLISDVLPTVIGVGIQSPTAALLSKGVRFALIKGGALLLKKFGSFRAKKAARKEKDK